MDKNTAELPILPFETVLKMWNKESADKSTAYLETAPMRVRIEEMQQCRKYLYALTRARKWWIEEIKTRDFEPWAKFWFQNEVTELMVLELMIALYEGRHLTVNDLVHQVGGSPSTVRSFISTAETLALVSKEKSPTDKRTILVKATRRTMISYENQLIIQQAMEIGIRNQYGLVGPKTGVSGLFSEWQKVVEMREKLCYQAGGYLTMEGLNQLQRLNLVFDEKFFPHFVPKKDGGIPT